MELSPKEAPEILYRFVTGHRQAESRLERGSELRRQMFEAIDRGERPIGYRPDWLRESAIDIIGTLTECAKEFNAAHPNDQISALDLLDVLTTAMGLLKKSTSKL